MSGSQLNTYVLRGSFRGCVPCRERPAWILTIKLWHQVLTMVLVHSIVLLVSFALLLKGADTFVKAAASIAKKLGVSEFMIGLTLVAVGTSLPELASTIAATYQGATGVIIGNVIGSNSANIGLIIGISVLLLAVKTKKSMLKRDGYLMLASSVLFFLAILDGVLTQLEGAVFLVLYAAYLLFLVETKDEREGSYHFRQFIPYFFRFRYLRTLHQSLRSYSRGKGFREPVGKDLLFLGGGGIAVALGSHYLIAEAVFFATLLGVTQTLVGLTIIAIGTSLPELVVSLAAIHRRYGSLAIGNILGSNIANVFLIAGVGGLLVPLAASATTIWISTPFMLLLSVLILLFIRSHWSVRREEGALLIALYLMFFVLGIGLGIL